MVFPYFCLVSSTPRTVYKNIKHTWINYPINSKTKTKSYLYFYFYKFQQFLTFSYISKLLQNASILIQLKIKILQPFFNFHTLQNTSCLHYWLNIRYCKQVFIFWWYGLTIILSLQHKSLFNCFFLSSLKSLPNSDCLEYFFKIFNFILFNFKNNFYDFFGKLCPNK